MSTIKYIVKYLFKCSSFFLKESSALSLTKRLIPLLIITVSKCVDIATGNMLDFFTDQTNTLDFSDVEFENSLDKSLEAINVDSTENDSINHNESKTLVRRIFEKALVSVIIAFIMLPSSKTTDTSGS